MKLIRKTYILYTFKIGVFQIEEKFLVLLSHIDKRAKQDLPGIAKIPSGIAMIFAPLEKYLNILVNVLADTVKSFYA